MSSRGYEDDCYICYEEITPCATPVDYYCCSTPEPIDKAFYANMADYVVASDIAGKEPVSILNNVQRDSNIIGKKSTNELVVLKDGLYDITASIVFTNNTNSSEDKLVGFSVSRQGSILYNNTKLVGATNGTRVEANLTSLGDLKKDDIIKLYFNDNDTTSIGDSYSGLESSLKIERLDSYRVIKGR